jgi:hypothetical protein
LELNGESEDSAPISRRGRVKWTQRPEERGGLGLTAVELEEPGNFWGIASPPSDWLPFSGARVAESSAPKPKTVAVLRSDAAPAAMKGKTVKETAGDSTAPLAQSISASRPASDTLGGFQQQLEKMLSEAADAAVREKVTSLLKDLREETKRVIVETTSSHAGSRMDQLLKQMNQTAEESARVRHSQWTEKLEAKLQQALTQFEKRSHEFEEASEKLATKAQAQLQKVFESSRTESVDRIVTRLKEQSAPVIDHARKAIADLTTREAEMERICQQHLEKSRAQIEESYARIDKKFEGILRERINTARTELEHAANAAAKSALNMVRDSAQQQEAEAQARLQSALAPVTERALAALKERAAELSREFAGEMSKYSRGHLESVSAAIIDLGKGIEKLSKVQPVAQDKSTKG